MKDRSAGIIPIFKKKNNYSFLLVHELAGHWGFPKGHPNPGEDDLVAALRELYEETEIDSCDIFDDFKYTQKYTYQENGQNVDKDVVFFLGSVNEQKVIPSNSEVQSSKWVSFEEAMSQLTFEESKCMIKNAMDHLQKKVPLKIRRYQFNH